MTRRRGKYYGRFGSNGFGITHGAHKQIRIDLYENGNRVSFFKPQPEPAQLATFMVETLGR